MARRKSTVLLLSNAYVDVCIQANVMLSYKLPAAIELLRTKLDQAQKNLESVIADLEYIKEQTTIMEVNTARVYNWDVKRRRERREKEERESSKS